MSRQNFSNPRCQAARPTLGFDGMVGLRALIHTGNGILGVLAGFVTGISNQVGLPPRKPQADGHRFRVQRMVVSD